MAGKPFGQAVRCEPREAFVEVDNGAEYEPIRYHPFICARRPGETAAADEPAIDRECIRPFDRDRCLGRRERRKRIGKRGHAGIEGAARLDELLFRLEHESEFRDVEPAREDQRPGAELSGVSRGMGKRIARLAST
jgi:hypothetical protein